MRATTIGFLATALVTPLLPSAAHAQTPPEDLVAFILWGAEDNRVDQFGLGPWRKLGTGKFDLLRRTPHGNRHSQITVRAINNCKYTIITRYGHSNNATTPFSYVGSEQDIDFSKISPITKFVRVSGNLFPGIGNSPMGTSFLTYVATQPGGICWAELDYKTFARTRTNCNDPAPSYEIPLRVRWQDFPKLQAALADFANFTCKAAKPS